MCACACACAILYLCTLISFCAFVCVCACPPACICVLRMCVCVRACVHAYACVCAFARARAMCTFVCKCQRQIFFEIVQANVRMSAFFVLRSVIICLRTCLLPLTVYGLLGCMGVARENRMSDGLIAMFVASVEMPKCGRAEKGRDA